MEAKNVACKEAGHAFSTANESIRAYNDDDIKNQMASALEVLAQGQNHKKYYIEKQRGLEKDIASIKKRIQICKRG